MTEKREFISTTEAAELLGVSGGYIRKLVAEGDLQAYRVRGNKVLKLYKDEVLALIEPVSPKEIEHPYRHRMDKE